MQKSRRWRGLELHLLSLGFLALACGASAAPANAPDAPATSASPPAAGTAAPVAPAATASATRAAAATATTEATTTTPASLQAAPESASAPDATTLPKGTLVLHIGDSFAAALGVELGKRLRAVGVRSALEYKTASYIPNWSFGPEIPEYLGKYHPDLVLVTLGANELEIPKPEQRVGAIKHLVSVIGTRPCVWIAPPLWKQDTGLLNVIKDNVAPCRYLDSNELVHDLPRGRDKIHPSPEGREIWAQIVFDWLVKERAGSEKQPWALKPEATP